LTPSLVLTRKEAADALRVSVWVLDRYIADRLLPTVKFPSSKRLGAANRRVLVAVVDLEAFVQKHREVA
jgi:hypothetical protein